MIIEIDNLSFEAVIGLLPFERENPQRVEIYIVIEYDYPCDNCEGGFLDYAKIAEIAKSEIVDKKYLLLEDAVYGIKNSIINIYPQINSISVSICKPDILPDCQVRVRENFMTTGMTSVA